MSNILDTISGVSQKTWNTIKAVGPLIISQSDRLSEQYQRHLGRIAEADALRAILLSEVEIRSGIRKKLLDRYIDSPIEERPRIEQDIQYLDGSNRILGVAVKSLNYSSADSAEPKSLPDHKPIEGHWLDRFNELARNRNENWREELLARALGKETAAPGSVSPRALWLIGSMEQAIFESFSKLLDLCIWQYPLLDPFLPDGKIQAIERRIQSGNELTVGHLLYQLGDIGLVADMLCRRRIPEGGKFLVRYGDQGRVIQAKQEITINGALLTPLGGSIASFYEPDWNAAGTEVFNDWIESITPEMADVSILTMPKQ